MEKLIKQMDRTTEKVYNLFVKLAKKMFRQNKQLGRQLNRRRGR